MRKNKINRMEISQSVSDVFPRFVAAAEARGLREKTLETYQAHIRCIGKHLELTTPFDSLTREMLDGMVVSMRRSGLSHNAISSYCRVFRTFLRWCRDEGYTALTLPPLKDEETVKETYTDEELARLLEKPKSKRNFCEYRNWVIVNFLLNSGCRAATIRNIQNRDVDFSARHVVFRHTKNGKVQTIPLCTLMIGVLRDYMLIRKGDAEDYLFCNEYGEMLTEGALRSAIADYNHRRGVLKTSIHLFRHTFARKYLIDCGGDAFTLQKLLGHSTLAMTKHYCAIFDADISRNYDNFSPLAQMTAGKEKIKMERRR